MRVPTGMSTVPASRLTRSPVEASHSTSPSLSTLKMNRTLRTAPPGCVDCFAQCISAAVLATRTMTGLPMGLRTGG
jgi:hypothetical protein